MRVYLISSLRRGLLRVWWIYVDCQWHSASRYFVVTFILRSCFRDTSLSYRTVFAFVLSILAPYEKVLSCPHCIDATFSGRPWPDWLRLCPGTPCCWPKTPCRRRLRSLPTDNWPSTRCS